MTGLPRDDFDTFIIEENGDQVAFFTMSEQHNLPYVKHFYTSRKHRNAKTARFLARSVNKYAKSKGAERIIFHTGKCRKGIQKVIEYYFKTKPYSIDGTNNYYCVGVK
jgi:hypothetical protein